MKLALFGLAIALPIALYNVVVELNCDGYVKRTVFLTVTCKK